MLSKGYDGMPRPTTADRLCCQRAKMACHARRRSTVCAAKRRRWHATPDAVRPCVPKGDDGMPRPMSFDRVCVPKVMMACDARRRSTMCAAQRQRGKSMRTCGSFATRRTIICSCVASGLSQNQVGEHVPPRKALHYKPAILAPP